MVEAALSQQLPGMAIIGLPDTALAEAKLRVRTATGQVGLPLSDRFLTVNLQPASLPKHGSSFDLAIALAVLAASGHLPPAALPRVAHLGELGLDGELRRPAGLLSAVVAARQLGFARVMVPASCAAEAALVPGVRVIAVHDLPAAVAWHRGEEPSEPHLPPASAERDDARSVSPSQVDASDIIGQDEAVEALVVAAAGRHHLSMLGPPGVVT